MLHLKAKKIKIKKSNPEDIKNKNIDLSVDFVFDGAYDSYDLYDFLDNNGYKYICRVKRSC